MERSFWLQVNLKNRVNLFNVTLYLHTPQILIVNVLLSQTSTKYYFNSFFVVASKMIQIQISFLDEDEVGDRITVRSDEELKAMLSYVSIYSASVSCLSAS